MLLTMLIWLYQGLIILPFGLTFMSLKPAAGKDRPVGISFFCITFLVGLALVTTLASFFSLVTNLGLWVNLVFIALAGIQWFFLIRKRLIPNLKLEDKPGRGMRAVLISLLSVAVASILASAVKVPSNPDTGIYHAQAIRWIETYRAVPGLGNLHERLAYNSSWLVVCALFSFSFLKGQSFHLLPSLLFLVAVVYFYEGLIAFSSGRFKLSNLMKVIFFVATFFFLLSEVSSPGTDLPVTLILWMLGSEWVRLLEEDRTGDFRQEIGLGVVAAFLVTIKFSSLAIIVFLAWVFFKLVKRKKLFELGLFSLASALVILPFVLRNLVLSGYLVYPGFPVDLFHFDWAIPVQKVSEESAVLHWFALMPGISRLDFEKLSWLEQYKRWFFNQIPRHKAMLVVLCSLPVLTVCLLPFRKFRSRLVEYRGLVGAESMLILGILFWLVTAPVFRFGYGFIIAALTLAGAFILLFLNDLLHPPKPHIIWTIILIALVFIFQAGMVSINSDHLSKIWLKPLDYPSWHTQTCQFGNFSMQCASQYASCWYDPFPCALVGNDKVFMRGTDFSQGFKVIP